VFPLIIVWLFNVVTAETFNDGIHVVALFNLVVPATFNDDKNVDAPETNKLVKLVLSNTVVDVNCKFEMFKFVNVDNEFKSLNIVVDVLFKLLI